MSDASVLLYPDAPAVDPSTPVPFKPAASFEPTTPDDMGARLYGDPSTTYAPALRALEKSGLDRLQTPEVAKAQAQAWGPLFARYEVGDALPVAEAIASVQANPPDAERRAAWAESSRQFLRAEYGDEAGVVLQRMQTMIKADPKLRDALNSSGLGDNPDIVRAMANSAERMRMAGKLK